VMTISRILLILLGPVSWRFIPSCKPKKQSPAMLASLFPGLANHRSKLLAGCLASNISLTFPPPLLTSPPYAQDTLPTLTQGMNQFLQVPSGGDPTDCLQLIPTYLKHCEISCLIALGEPISATHPLDESIIMLLRPRRSMISTIFGLATADDTQALGTKVNTLSHTLNTVLTRASVESDHIDSLIHLEQEATNKLFQDHNLLIQLADTTSNDHRRHSVLLAQIVFFSNLQFRAALLQQLTLSITHQVEALFVSNVAPWGSDIADTPLLTTPTITRTSQGVDISYLTAASELSFTHYRFKTIPFQINSALLQFLPPRSLITDGIYVLDPSDLDMCWVMGRTKVCPPGISLTHLNPCMRELLHIGQSQLNLDPCKHLVSQLDPRTSPPQQGLTNTGFHYLFPSTRYCLPNMWYNDDHHYCQTGTHSNSSTGPLQHPYINLGWPRSPCP